MKTNYQELLRRKAMQYREDIESQAPISLTQYRSKLDRQRWLEKLAAIASGKTPPEAA